LFIGQLEQNQEVVYFVGEINQAINYYATR